jgi:type IV secretion system protein TrbE
VSAFRYRYNLTAQLNLYGFWDEHCFLTKTGNLGAVLKISGIDYESLET